MCNGFHKPGCHIWTGHRWLLAGTFSYGGTTPGFFLGVYHCSAQNSAWHSLITHQLGGTVTHQFPKLLHFGWWFGETDDDEDSGGSIDIQTERLSFVHIHCLVIQVQCRRTGYFNILSCTALNLAPRTLPFRCKLVRLCLGIFWGRKTPPKRVVFEARAMPKSPSDHRMLQENCQAFRTRQSHLVWMYRHQHLRRTFLKCQRCGGRGWTFMEWISWNAFVNWFWC